jgi:rhodanese-related sulfurtransferase
VAGALAGLAGNAQALAAIRLLLGLPTSEPLTTWVYDAADPVPRKLKWKADPGCSCHRGPGDWSWLDEALAGGRMEAPWTEVAPADRQVVVDVRELHEIEPAQWDWFEAQGSRVVHFPWSEWSAHQPEWQPGTAYLVVCARGYRSLAAVETVPPGIRAVSLTGGVFGLVSLIQIKEPRPRLV